MLQELLLLKVLLEQEDFLAHKGATLLVHKGRGRLDALTSRGNEILGGRVAIKIINRQDGAGRRQFNSQLGTFNSPRSVAPSVNDTKPRVLLSGA